MQDGHRQQIEPAEFSPQGAVRSTASTAQRPPNAKKWGLGVLLILALLALILVFWQPDRPAPVPSVAQPVTQHEGAQPEPPRPNLRPPSESPWADSQLLKARRDAQQVLAELLASQQRLEKAQADIWAAEQIAQLATLASTGDRAYQERQFAESIAAYRQALELAQQLEAQIPATAQRYYDEGLARLAQNQPQQATELLLLANRLAPADAAIDTALARAEVRPQVLALMERSAALQADPQTLPESRQALLEAQTLDAAYPPLAARLAAVEQAITERDFTAQMSAGFAALSAGNYRESTRAFTAAARLKPDDLAATEALRQVEAAKLGGERERKLTRAQRLEQDENWQAALDAYAALLAADTSLSAARLGQLRSEARLNLDNRIQAILAEPLALNAEPAWRAANQVLTDAQAVRERGPRLAAQIEELAKTLRRARTPVVVRLRSDQQTEIEIYRVGKLGTLTAQALNLYPGRYVVIGRCAGFRDQRIELLIDGSKPEIDLLVVCDTPI
ncbi:MAG: hypothetical protein GDA55_03785 [Cellvibrionales bacterium]|nr:hypothetical protein [Cellvibrionales bacterium]